MSDKLGQVEATDLDDVIARVKAAAFDAGRTCEHCRGEGSIRDGSNLIVHSLGSFIGADWGVDDVVDAVRTSKQVVWGPGHGHDLEVKLQDGRWMKFQVPHPARDGESQ